MIVGVTQAAAEEYYITMVMQLEGYGHETFSAKVKFNFINRHCTILLITKVYSQYFSQDETNNEVVLGISINGIMVCYPNTQATHFYRY